ncbi:MAG: cache domain-containing protein [Rhodospirillales bacterium]|nr:cache domain-containing protein [Rhodospirillales bacterium]
MKRILTSILAMLALFAVHATASAQSRGTPDEAKAMVAKAAALIGSAGAEKAFATFNDPAGGFVDRDLYVFVLDLDGNTMAHGGNKGLIGRSLINLKDADGKAFVHEMIAISNTKGEGWVDYTWVNPTNKKIEPKSSLVKKVDKFIVGVGVYKG